MKEHSGGKDVKALSENGKYEVKELCIKDGESTYLAVIKADFALVRKAYGVLIDTKFSAGSKGDSEVQMNLDIIGAGDKLLFMGWHSGDEKIKEVVRLRMKACQELGGWLTDIVSEDEDSDSEEEKKT